MADNELNVDVVLESEERKEIVSLREQKRRIDKRLKALAVSVKDESKIEEWRMINELRREITLRLRKQGVSWKKFVETPPYFEYAWYKQTGGTRRLVTSMTKPTSSETTTDEATMIRQAKEQRAKMVRRKPRKASKKTPPETTSGKSEAIARAITS